jgi:hypothetical protein
MPPPHAQHQHPAVEERATQETIVEELIGEDPPVDGTVLASEPERDVTRGV